ncbi:hypothetical protein ACFO0N_20995 [Halobium salinum]|uniref:Uncharacterized protein n=1 Tax=Halobium salinum TaxID=1364940 RepID=A0ABD5PIH1_9EURY|nr:hypothetical protein [Halobium salinum]
MFDFLRLSPLFSIRRFTLCLLVTVFVVTTDVLFIHLKDIKTVTEFVTEVGIHTLGFYIGFTVVALFDQSGGS